MQYKTKTYKSQYKTAYTAWQWQSTLLTQHHDNDYGLVNAGNLQ